MFVGSGWRGRDEISHLDMMGLHPSRPGADHRHHRVAGGLIDHTKLQGLAQGLKRVGPVLLGCFMGLRVSVLMSRFYMEVAGPTE